MVKADKPESEEQSDPALAEDVGRLTLGERQCLELVTSGMVSKEIARVLDISPHTVDARLRTASRKLSAPNRFVAAQMLVDLQKGSGEADLDLLSDTAEDAAAHSGSDGDGAAVAEFEAGDERYDEASLRRKKFAPAALLSKVLPDDAELSVGRRLLLILAVVVGTAALFTVVGTTLFSFSDWLSANS